MGTVFDAYRVLTGQLRISRWLLPLFDLLYWTGVTLFVFGMLKHSNQGQLRFFVFVGLALGAVFYYLLFSGTVIRLVHLIIRGVVWTAGLLRRLFYILVVGPLKFLWRTAVVLSGVLASAAVLLFRIMLQLLYPFRILGRWIWNLTLGRLPWADYLAGLRKLGSRLTRWFRK